MEHVLFLLGEKTPSGVFTQCEEACAHLRQNGVTAAVGTESAHAGYDAQTLVLCDDPVLLKMLAEQGAPVIALQHEANAKERFAGASYIFSEPEEVDFDSYVKAWQRLSGLPWDILETTRLRLRETTLADLDAFYEIYAMPGMTQYMEGLFPDKEDEARYLEDYIHNVYGLMGFGVWTVLEKETGDIVGRCGFSVRKGFEEIELGFLTGTCWQGKGYAQEACRAVLRYGRDTLGIDTVQALVKEENDVSRHILEKLGFIKDRTVDAEEGIYGKSYPATDKTGAHRSPVSPARFGTFDYYLLHMVSGSG